MTLGTQAMMITNVTTPEDVEILRQLRNATRGTFSHDNTEISTREQEVWWDRHNEHIVAFYVSLDDEPVGFAVLTILPEEIVSVGLPRRLEESATTSVGVLPKARGKKLGYALMWTLEQAYPGPLVACARLDNPGGMAMHRESAGWRETHRDATHAYYRREARL